tara:strand:+ start:359 stop:922 length:564 start_codon:yes stop_codon:yes gene_type:complete
MTIDTEDVKKRKQKYKRISQAGFTIMFVTVLSDTWLEPILHFDPLIIGAVAMLVAFYALVKFLAIRESVDGDLILRSGSGIYGNTQSGVNGTLFLLHDRLEFRTLLGHLIVFSDEETKRSYIIYLKDIDKIEYGSKNWLNSAIELVFLDGQKVELRIYSNREKWIKRIHDQSLVAAAEAKTEKKAEA